MAKKNNKQSSNKMAKLASKVLKSNKSTKSARSLAGSVLAQARKTTKKNK
ncbi:hypothetical protein [Macrococcoides canis]|nr:hypothetical protein [Macrococcus canis]